MYVYHDGTHPGGLGVGRSFDAAAHRRPRPRRNQQLAESRQRRPEPPGCLFRSEAPAKGDPEGEIVRAGQERAFSAIRKLFAIKRDELGQTITGQRRRGRHEWHEAMLCKAITNQWARLDSNQRRQSHQIYSLTRLSTSVHARVRF